MAQSLEATGGDDSWNRTTQLWMKAQAGGFPSAPPQPTEIQREAVRVYFENKNFNECLKLKDEIVKDILKDLDCTNN